jgi:hypothetical protein
VAVALLLLRCVTQRFAEEHQRRTAADTHGRLGDDDRHRQKAAVVEQPFRHVESAVVGSMKLGGSRSLRRARNKVLRSSMRLPQGARQVSEHALPGKWKC